MQVRSDLPRDLNTRKGRETATIISDAARRISIAELLQTKLPTLSHRPPLKPKKEVFALKASKDGEVKSIKAKKTADPLKSFVVRDLNFNSFKKFSPKPPAVGAEKAHEVVPLSNSMTQLKPKERVKSEESPGESPLRVGIYRSLNVQKIREKPKHAVTEITPSHHLQKIEARNPLRRPSATKHDGARIKRPSRPEVETLKLQMSKPRDLPVPNYAATVEPRKASFSYTKLDNTSLVRRPSLIRPLSLVQRASNIQHTYSIQQREKSRRKSWNKYIASVLLLAVISFLLVFQIPKYVRQFVGSITHYKTCCCEKNSIAVLDHNRFVLSYMREFELLT